MSTWVGLATTQVGRQSCWGSTPSSPAPSTSMIFEYTVIRMYHWTGPWSFYERLSPLDVQYDGGISLMGFALGQGTEEHSASSPFEPERARPFWIALSWETLEDLEVDFSISLRLYNDEGGVVLPGRLTLVESAAPAYERMDTRRQDGDPISVQPACRSWPQEATTSDSLCTMSRTWCRRSRLVCGSPSSAWQM